jgi:hypothetical protein
MTSAAGRQPWYLGVPVRPRCGPGLFLFRTGRALLVASLAPARRLGDPCPAQGYDLAGRGGLGVVFRPFGHQPPTLLEQIAGTAALLAVATVPILAQAPDPFFAALDAYRRGA